MIRTCATTIALLALTGCSTTAPVVPAQLLTCQGQPRSPAAATQRDVGLYVLDLAAAGDDCRTKLNAVREILTPET